MVTSKAEARARKLLRQCLSADQRITFDRHGYFDVKGGATGIVYRIRADDNYFPGSHNIMDSVKGYNAWPHGAREGHLPKHDALLAQKIFLESDELKFTGIACKMDAERAIRYYRHREHIFLEPGLPRRRLDPADVVFGILFAALMAASAGLMLVGLAKIFLK